MPETARKLLPSLPETKNLPVGYGAPKTMWVWKRCSFSVAVASQALSLHSLLAPRSPFPERCFQRVVWITSIHLLESHCGGSACCSCSVPKSCLTSRHSTDYSTPGFPALHHLQEFAQTHVHWVGDPTISSSVVPFSSCPQSFPASESFLMSQFFAWGGQSNGVSASASVLPMNTQDWYPLGETGWISLQS